MDVHTVRLRVTLSVLMELIDFRDSRRGGSYANHNL